MRDGWRTYKLQEVIEKFIDYRGKTPHKTTSGIPLITAKIVKGGFINEPEEFIAEEDYKLWMTRGLPQKGDIVLTTEAPLGEVAQIRTKDKVALAQRIITLRGREGILDNTFLKFALQNPIMQQRLHSRASGSTVQGIKSAELQKVDIELPPLPIQRRIADILGALDDKIECNRRMNETLEEMAKALYKHWFVDFGPFRDGEFVDSEMGKIPKGWEVGRVRDLCDFAYGKGLPEVKRITGPYPVYGSAGIVGMHNEYLVETPGLVIGRKGTIGKLHRARKPFFPIDTTYYVVPKSSEYGFDFLFLTLGRLGLEDRNNDSAVPGLNREDVYKLLVLKPPKSILHKFNQKVCPVYAHIDSLLAESQTLARTRDYLLPKLLSGEIEVKGGEEEVAEIA